MTHTYKARDLVKEKKGKLNKANYFHKSFVMYVLRSCNLVSPNCYFIVVFCAQEVL